MGEHRYEAAQMEFILNVWRLFSLMLNFDNICDEHWFHVSVQIIFQDTLADKKLSRNSGVHTRFFSPEVPARDGTILWNYIERKLTRTRRHSVNGSARQVIFRRKKMPLACWHAVSCQRQHIPECRGKYCRLKTYYVRVPSFSVLATAWAKFTTLTEYGLFFQVVSWIIWLIWRFFTNLLGLFMFVFFAFNAVRFSSHMLM